VSAREGWKFDVFELRVATEEHSLLAKQWTNSDTWHMGRIDPSFWTTQKPGADAFVLCDYAGPLFFFKMVRVGLNRVHLHLQFSPWKNDWEKERRREALQIGTRWLEEVLPLNDVAEICFDTYNSELAAFARRRLGFFKDGTLLVKRLGGHQDERPERSTAAASNGTS
jgi:hypothetical protein